MTHSLREVAPTLWAVQSRAFAMNSLVALAGDEALLVDPGVTPDEIEAIADFVAGRGATVTIVVLTHSHWDHVLGANRFPDAVIVAHERFTATLLGTQEWAAAHFAEVESSLGVQWPEPRFPTAAPGHLIPATATGLVQLPALAAWGASVLPVPGHAADQIAILFQPANLLFAADILSDIEIPLFMEGDLDAYRETLRRVEVVALQQRVMTVIPGHGGAARGWPSIQARILRDRRYLEAVDTCIAETLAAGGDEADAQAGCADIPLLPKMAHEHNANVSAHFRRRAQMV